MQISERPRSEKAPENSAEKKTNETEKELSVLSKRQSEQLAFTEKHRYLNQKISGIKQSHVLNIDIEAMRVGTEEKIQELEQGMGVLSAENQAQIRKNNVGSVEIAQQQAQRELHALIEEKKELLRSRLLDNWGISFSSRLKDKTHIPIEDQLAIAKEVKPQELQIDLRGRPDLDHIKKNILQFQQESGATNMSLHGETPQIDEFTFEIKNIERLRQEIQLAIKTGSDIYTIHSPHIPKEAFAKLSLERQECILQTFSSFVAESIKQALDAGQFLSVAIENIPVKGEEGKIGHSIEDINSILDRVVKILDAQYGLDPQDVERYIGVTLDINHALTKGDNPETIMRQWFDSFGKKLKAFHIYSPSSPSPEFDHKLSQFIKLYKEYGIDAPIYLESKQTPIATGEVFLAGRKNSEIQMREQEVVPGKEQELANLLEAVRSVYHQAKVIRASEADISIQAEQLQNFIAQNEIISEYLDVDDKNLLRDKALGYKQGSTKNILDDLSEMVTKVIKRVDQKWAQ